MKQCVFHGTVFSKKYFHFQLKELKLERNNYLFISSHSWTGTSLICKTPKHVCDFFISKYLLESNFCTIGPLHFYPIIKHFVTFHFN